ncbi:DEAD/DEAH box helicase [Heyndrickxia acidicola]|uniref:DEAD/DEAH box helicase n=1 Tax=Heyndrickxia acidicola TaxID=209389 RepID=A0ABU6MFP3_9BACI|nr:DEAD/DEAH box helicase [Heyndrickxia acidicola]MED1203513.1 DEAD/DEAH box helicase [Heyndrickxia acidicola]
MNYFLNSKKIKDICGEVSHKKGKKRYAEGKVTFKGYHPSSPTVEASVKGQYTFHVSIEKVQNNISASCTCPQLPSVPHYCQHVAAVLIGLHDFQVNGIPKTVLLSNGKIPPKSAKEGKEKPILQSKQTPAIKGNGQLAREILRLFQDQPVTPISHQYSVDDRTLLNTEFTCRTITFSKENVLFGIEIKVGDSIVRNVNEFLKHVEQRKPFTLAKNVTYQPNLHRFSQETTNVFNQLIHLINSENMFLDTLVFDSSRVGMLNDIWILIPPSAWATILPLLLDAPRVRMIHGRNEYGGIKQSNETMPLEFCFKEGRAGSCQLHVKNVDQITIMRAYDTVLFENKLYKLSAADCKRLLDLKKLLETSGTYRLEISLEEMEHFTESVMAGFMKLGHVRISEGLSGSMGHTSFKGKLYLDRVKNRLLAGLEFHYGNLIMNPLEESLQADSHPLFKRNGAKEQEIMQLMEEGLFSKTDSGYFLHNEEAEYHFLHSIIPKLKNHVEIYATTAVKDRLVRMESRPHVRVEVDERTDWLIFEFDMEGIPEREIRNVLLSLNEKRKYYRLKNGSLLSLETKDFQEINKFLNSTGITTESLEGAEIRIPFPHGLQKILSFQGSVVNLGKSYRDIMTNLQSTNKARAAVPESLDNVLRNYQKYGFQWLKTIFQYQFGAILADDMGLGKTLQVIAFILSELASIRNNGKPVLVVTPSSLVYNWMNELNKFAPEIKAVIADGSKPKRNRILKNTSKADVIITSYPLLRQDSNNYHKQTFHTIVLDEAQAFKNPSTQTAKAVKMLQGNCRFALTGTPVENSLDDLWSIFNVVFPGLLPERKTFKDLPRETIARMVKPFILRRLKSEVLMELPEKIELIHTSNLLTEQKKIYAAYLSKLKYETLKHLSKDTFHQNQIKILAGLTRLRQLCCHPALFVEGYKGSSAKFEHLMKIVEECRNTGRRMLIFSQFTRMLGIMGREFGLRGIPYFYLDGSTPSPDRVELCRRFNQGENQVFLISLKAGGTGLNLTGADTVILYDLWWNPAVEQQATDRAYRMGQKHNVQVIKMVTKGTIEEKMNELQERKKNLIEEIIQPGQEEHSMLTEQEIKEILMID